MGIFEKGDERHGDCEFKLSVASKVTVKISEYLPRGSDMVKGRSVVALCRIWEVEIGSCLFLDDS